MTEKAYRERDIVRELHEDATWSMWTNTFNRRRGWGRGSLPPDPGVQTFMVAAVLVAAVVIGAIGLIILVFEPS